METTKRFERCGFTEATQTVTIFNSCLPERFDGEKRGEYRARAFPAVGEIVTCVTRSGRVMRAEVLDAGFNGFDAKLVEEIDETTPKAECAECGGTGDSYPECCKPGCPCDSCLDEATEGETMTTYIVSGYEPGRGEYSQSVECDKCDGKPACVHHGAMRTFAETNTAEQFGYAVETHVDFDHECTCQPLQNGLGFARGLRMRDAHQRAASINRQRCCERHKRL